MKEEKQISNVCRECGITANALTCLKKYGRLSKQLAYTLSTYHKGECDYCKEEKEITEVRDFFYPDFGLIQKFLNVFRK